MGKTAGDWGEALIANYLRKKGYTIVAHSYRCRFGEIDLIAQKGALLCFVEVKLRSGLEHGLPREFVTAGKQEKLRTTAQFYLAERGIEPPVRFDVAEVYTDADFTPQHTRIEYIEDAF